MEEKYLDQIKKAEFFREQILKEYLKVGRGIDSETIDKHVKQLETRTAILSQISIEDGSDFDVEQINRTLFYLYNDLRILYEIIVEHKKNRFMLLKEELDFKLQSLETIANEYKNKAEFEYIYSSIGQTLLYKAGDYNIEKLSDQIIIDLGSIKVHECDKVFGMVGGTNFDSTRTIFTLEREDNGNQIIFVAYQNTNNATKIPGTREEAYYEYKSDTENILSDFRLSIPELLADEDNDYYILGSKNCITINEPGIKTTIQTKLADEVTIPNATAYTEFYIYKASYITFEFSEQPTEKNFEGYEINAPDEIQRIMIKGNDGLKFNFETDGILYASYKKGYVVNQDLFCEARRDKDFFIVEKKIGKEVLYNAKVTISNINPDEINIDYIAIKQKSWD